MKHLNSDQNQKLSLLKTGWGLGGERNLNSFQISTRRGIGKTLFYKGGDDSCRHVWHISHQHPSITLKHGVQFSCAPAALSLTTYITATNSICCCRFSRTAAPWSEGLTQENCPFKPRINMSLALFTVLFNRSWLMGKKQPFTAFYFAMNSPGAPISPKPRKKAIFS